MNTGTNKLHNRHTDKEGSFDVPTRNAIVRVDILQCYNHELITRALKFHTCKGQRSLWFGRSLKGEPKEFKADSGQELIIIEGWYGLFTLNQFEFQWKDSWCVDATSFVNCNLSMSREMVLVSHTKKLSDSRLELDKIDSIPRIELLISSQVSVIISIFVDTRFGIETKCCFILASNATSEE